MNEECETDIDPSIPALPPPLRDVLALHGYNVPISSEPLRRSERKRKIKDWSD